MSQSSLLTETENVKKKFYAKLARQSSVGRLTTARKNSKYFESEFCVIVTIKMFL